MNLRALAAVALVAVVACGDGARPRPIAVLTISTTWPGASAEAVEQSVVVPLEQAASRVKGIGDITSRAEAGVATLVVDVDRGHDVQRAALAMSRALRDVHAQLPADAMPPVVQTSRADDRPAITLSLEGNVSRGELGVIARRDVARELERLVGVGRIELRGFTSPAVVLAPDLEHLAATRTTLAELANAVERASTTLPGGRIDATGAQLRVQAGDNSDLASLQDLVIGQVGDVPVRVRDVAQLWRDFTPAPEREPPRIAVHAQLGALRIDVAGAVRARLRTLNLPMSVNVTEVPARALPAPKRVAVSIVGMELAELERLADAAVAEAKAAGIADVERAPSGAPELVLEPDRDRAASYGISTSDLVETIRLATDDARVAELTLDGEELPILLRHSPSELPARLSRISVRSRDGTLVPVSGLVAVSDRAATSVLRRNGQRAIDLLAPEAAAAKVRSIVERGATKWPAGYRAVRPR